MFVESLSRLKTMDMFYPFIVVAFFLQCVYCCTTLNYHILCLNLWTILSCESDSIKLSVYIQQEYERTPNNTRRSVLDYIMRNVQIVIIFTNSFWTPIIISIQLSIAWHMLSLVTQSYSMNSTNLNYFNLNKKLLNA